MSGGLLGGLLSLPAHGFGLGVAVAESHLGEPLAVAIPLHGDPAPDWPVACRWRWSAAGDASWSRARGADLGFEERDGRPYLSLTTRRRVAEPILEFAVVVTCGLRAEVERHYVLLLDPAPGVLQGASSPASPPAVPARPLRSPVPPRPPTPPPQPPSGDYSPYRVRPGDSLLAIVRDHYGERAGNPWVRVAEVMAANPELFAEGDPDRLAAGVTLRLPLLPQSEPGRAPLPPEPVASRESAPSTGVLRILPADEEPRPQPLRLGWELDLRGLELAVDNARVAVVNPSAQGQAGGQSAEVAPPARPAATRQGPLGEATTPGPGPDSKWLARLEESRGEMLRLQARVAELEALLAARQRGERPAATQSLVPPWLWWAAPVLVVLLLIAAMLLASRRRGGVDDPGAELSDLDLQFREPALGPGPAPSPGARISYPAPTAAVDPRSEPLPGPVPDFVAAASPAAEVPRAAPVAAPTESVPGGGQEPVPAPEPLEATLEISLLELENAVAELGTSGDHPGDRGPDGVLGFDLDLDLDLDLSRAQSDRDDGEFLNLAAAARGGAEETVPGLEWSSPGQDGGAGAAPREPAKRFGARSISGLLLEVELHLLYEQYGEAIATLHALIDRDSDREPDMRPWSMLFSVYRQQGDRVRFDELRQRFSQRYNVVPPTWDGEQQEAARRQGLDERFPRVMQRVEQVWGSRYAADLLNGLLLDDRDGQRQGFDMDVAEDISFLRELCSIRAQL